MHSDGHVLENTCRESDLYQEITLYRLFDVFSREFNFPDFGFFEFRGNRHQGIIFRGFVQYVKVTKTEAIWPLQLHCLQSISLIFGNVNNGRRLFANFFQLEFVFTGFNLSQIDENPQNSPKLIRSHKNFMPQGNWQKNTIYSKLAYSINKTYSTNNSLDPSKSCELLTKKF